MTRIAKILATALAISLVAASAAIAKAPQHSQAAKHENDTAAIVVVAALGALVAGSALVSVGRKSGSAAPAA